MQVAPGTWRLTIPVLGLGGATLLWAPYVGLLAILLGAVIVWFHRDPERTPPDRGVVSPADGTVTVIREEGGRLRVGVFMNVTDVHVNRAPVSGRIEAVEHEPGGHWPAFSKDAERNERVHFALGEFDVTLIAGTVARRIHPYLEVGDTIERGERLGHVSFGSRADVLLPARFDRGDLRVRTGEGVRAGASVLAVDPDS